MYTLRPKATNFSLRNEMKRLISILLMFCAIQASVAQVPNITAMEYYLDVDPGFGMGTTIPVTAAPTQDVNFSVPTGALSAGFHTLHIRQWMKMVHGVILRVNLSISPSPQQNHATTL